jgi:hypothetical protein
MVSLQWTQNVKVIIHLQNHNQVLTGWGSQIWSDWWSYMMIDHDQQQGLWLKVIMNLWYWYSVRDLESSIYWYVLMCAFVVYLFAVTVAVLQKDWVMHFYIFSARANSRRCQRFPSEDFWNGYVAPCLVSMLSAPDYPGMENPPPSPPPPQLFRAHIPRF